MEAVQMIKVENGFDLKDSSQEFKNWAMEKNNFMLLDQKKDWREMTDFRIAAGRNLQAEGYEERKKDEGAARLKMVQAWTQVSVCQYFLNSCDNLF
ncbi:hypothetical protein RhiirA5_435887 [Rhizophagus irregularis]|uniref:Uncharacterized protein n=1 Tax=Rhizophagus irregularis TaxID=588596 RepID=A0A2I1FKV5_9GLOM|nr:hypothetical protein RhiirA5_435887 [Rhizophagus irregularis]PKY35009.1 hypothetical protein RhiirB3_455293 [Rhizophagus irregularis]